MNRVEIWQRRFGFTGILFSLLMIVGIFSMPMARQDPTFVAIQSVMAFMLVMVFLRFLNGSVAIARIFMFLSGWMFVGLSILFFKYIAGIFGFNDLFAPSNSTLAWLFIETIFSLLLVIWCIFLLTLFFKKFPNEYPQTVGRFHTLEISTFLASLVMIVTTLNPLLHIPETGMIMPIFEISNTNFTIMYGWGVWCGILLGLGGLILLASLRIIPKTLNLYLCKGVFIAFIISLFLSIYPAIAEIPMISSIKVPPNMETFFYIIKALTNLLMAIFCYWLAESWEDLVKNNQSNKDSQPVSQ
jgi:hypothetical protein